MARVVATAPAILSLARRTSREDPAMPHLAALAWVALVVAALLVGYSKTAINSVAPIAVAVFAAVLPARQSTGTLLPLLLCGDVMAITVYRRHIDWSLIVRLLPWIAGGLSIGAAFIAVADDSVMRKAIGVLLLVLVAVQVISGRRSPKQPHRLLGAAAGVGTGFATMIANAAGPITTLYLLSSGYEVMQLVGAAAWLFFIVNLIKLPISIGLGLVHPGSIALDAALLPAMLLGGWVGAVTIRRVSRVQFERYVLVLVAVSALLLLV